MKKNTMTASLPLTSTVAGLMAQSMNAEPWQSTASAPSQVAGTMAQEAPLSVGSVQEAVDHFQAQGSSLAPVWLETPTLPPTTSLRQERLRRNILSNHRELAKTNPEGVQAKFALLKESPFVFFRGTADFFYEELAGEDRYLPKVLCNGDIHPLNFGVLQAAEGGLFFGPNDPDESYHAPFSWDLRRGAAAFEVLMREHGASATDRLETSESFVSAYLDALQSYDGNDRERTHRITADNDSPEVRELLLRAGAGDRVTALARHVDLAKGRFHGDSGLVSQSERVAEFQGHIDTYRSTLGPDAPIAEGPFRVKDVAIKHSSGVGSCGLIKYFVLVEGKTGRPEDDMILEFKQERDSVLERHVLTSPLRYQMDGARAAEGMRVHNHRGDPFVGHAEVDGKSFLVAEYSPYYAEIDPAALSPQEMKSYAASCGRALALAHARADEDTGADRGSMEARILQSVRLDTFAEEIASWASDVADHVIADHQAFLQLDADGAFSSLQ